MLTSSPEDSDARSSLRTAALVTLVFEFQFSYLPQYFCTFCSSCLEYSSPQHTFMLSLSSHTHTHFLTQILLILQIPVEISLPLRSLL